MSDENLTGTLEDLAREYLKDHGSAVAYLRQAWLSGAVAALREARREAELTQEDIARRLGTTQSAVARLERDSEGRMTLHQFIDYAVACEKLPLDVELVDIEAVRTMADPGALGSAAGSVRNGDPRGSRTDSSTSIWKSCGKEAEPHGQEFSEAERGDRRHPERRARVDEYKRAIYDILELAKLREARRVTQTQLAATLDVTQANVSRIEHEDDIYLSTLSGYVQALGGKLEVQAVFPDQTIRIVGKRPAKAPS